MRSCAKRPKQRSDAASVLVLASASPRRRAILKQSGLTFRVVPPRYQEGRPRGDPGQFVKRAACAKALEVGKRLRSAAWVIAADTLVLKGEKIFGKPGSRLHARSMLRRLSGQEHQVLTGVSLCHVLSGAKLSWVEKTRVRMRRIGKEEMEKYLDTGAWKDKAGAYGIQGLAGAFVTRITGCYYNVVGLPVGSLCEKLLCLGIIT
jgi:septum formation protein